MEKDSRTLKEICIYSTKIKAISLKCHISKAKCPRFRNMKFDEISIKIERIDASSGVLRTFEAVLKLVLFYSGQ